MGENIKTRRKETEIEFELDSSGMGQWLMAGYFIESSSFIKFWKLLDQPI
jgi:hypothetical protein